MPIFSTIVSIFNMNLCCNADFVKRLQKQFSLVTEKKQGGSSKPHFVLYGLSQCPYCVAAQNELSKLKHSGAATHKTHMIPSEASHAERSKFRARIARLHTSYNPNTHTTFPVIFKDDSFVGGYTELVSADSTVNTVSLH